jgi:hypothetical protein
VAIVCIDLSISLKSWRGCERMCGCAHSEHPDLTEQGRTAQPHLDRINEIILSLMRGGRLANARVRRRKRPELGSFKPGSVGDATILPVKMRASIMSMLSAGTGSATAGSPQTAS